MARVGSGAYTVFYHRYHIIWITKYRYQVMTGELRLRLREIIRQACAELGVTIVKGVLSTDHVHISDDTISRRLRCSGFLMEWML